MSKQHSVYSVFTPTTQAQLNFVPRKAVSDQLVDALLTPGKQLIVYGESGSGKSTLLLNKLRETYTGHITTQCSTATTYDGLILDAFDQLDQYYLQGKATQKSKNISPSLITDFLRIKASVNATFGKAVSETEARILPPQLTAQRLAQFLGAQGICWVIEDFHKMEPKEKLPFSQSLKVFCDVSASYPDVKTIAIGATETARQVVEYDPEMRNRVSELAVPLMTNEELSRIVLNGQELLNIDLSHLVNPIVQYSVGVPSVCHQLALNACLEKGVMVTQLAREPFVADDLKPAVVRYVRESSDTLKSTFDKALRRRKIRKFDNCRLILQALAKGPLDGREYAEILSSIHAVVSDYPAGNLSQYLNELTHEERGGILRVGLDRKYRFVDPLYHTFAQLTLLEQPPGGNFIHESVAELAAFTLSSLIRDDPQLKLIYFAGHGAGVASTSPLYDASRDQLSVSPLTAREIAVLSQVSAGMSTVEIANNLYISLNTVKSHLNAIYRKLSASNRAEAILKAREMKLL